MIINRLSTPKKLCLSLVIALVVSFIARGRLTGNLYYMLIWVTYALSLMVLTWIPLLTSRPKDIKQLTKKENLSRLLVFCFILISTFSSLFIIFALFHSGDYISKQKINHHILFSLINIICSWLLVHTIFILRYAHLFYWTADSQDEFDMEIPGGIIFPRQKEPTYYDFAYLSFVIGMTCQVSDIKITSRTIRRTVLMHGLVSFMFNVLIIAFLINILSGILEK